MECKKCKYWSERDGEVLRGWCNRYPKIEIKGRTNWCGEFRKVTKEGR